MIKGIIYDLDDLMVDLNPLHVKTWEILLEKFGHSLGELPEKLVSSFMGMRVIDILKEIVKYLKLDVNVENFYQERTNIFLELVKEQLEAMPGLYESLRFFKEHGYLVAIASSGAKKYINLVLERFKIADYFSVVVSGDDVSKGKPDPEIYIIASKKLGLVANECLVLEDATSGINSAKGAGCRCIAVRNLKNPPQDYSQADKIINSLVEISPDMIRLLS